MRQMMNLPVRKKALIASNPKKFFKNKFSKFRGSGNARTDGGGNGYKGGNLYAEKNNGE